jgi:hypothetical protein
MMKHLGSDLDDVVFDEEIQPPAWWIVLLGFTSKESTWTSSSSKICYQKPTRTLEANLHTFHFDFLGHWVRVIQCKDAHGVFTVTR